MKELEAKESHMLMMLQNTYKIEKAEQSKLQTVKSMPIQIRQTTTAGQEKKV